MNEREDLMVSLGIQRYDGIISSAEERGCLSNTPHGTTLLTRITYLVEEGVVQWIKEASRKAGQRHHAVHFLKQVKPGQAALIACRAFVDKLAEGTRSETRLALSVGLYIEHEAYLQAFRREARPLWKDLLRRQRRAGVEHKRKVFVSAANRTGVSFQNWTPKDRAVVGLVMLDIIQQKAGLFDRKLYKKRRGSRLVTEVRLNPTSALVGWLSSAHENHALRLPVLLPTIDPPIDWTNNWDGGYHGLRLPEGGLMQVKGAIKHITEHLNASETPEVLRGVNMLQSTPWLINAPVRATLGLLWDAGAKVAGLPGDEAEELPPRPAEMDEPERSDEESELERKGVIRRWKRDAARVHSRNAELFGHRLLVSRTLDVADIVGTEPFYFPQKMDFRGRVYPVPAFLQPQGADTSKGLLQFARSQRVDVGSGGEGWLSVQAANTYGDDKIPLWERRAWARGRKDAITAAARYPMAQTWWQEADKPFQFLAVCRELADVWEHGYVDSRVPVAIDGSNNGLQIFSLMLRDPVGGRSTNCIPSARPEDIYQEVADAATVVIRRKAKLGERWAQAWCDFLGESGLPRKSVKRPVMTMPYGAKRVTARDYFRTWLRHEVDRPDEALSSSVFNVADIVWDCILRAVPKASQAMGWLRSVASLASEANVPLVWRTPIVNITAGQGYRNNKSERIETILHGTVKRRRQITIAHDGVRMAKTKMKDAISPNLVHSLDASALFLTMDKMGDAGVRDYLMVHDSYATHANNVEVMFRSVREAYAEIFSGNFLEDWRQQVIPQLGGAAVPAPPEQGTMNPDLVLKSDHFFH